jgi:hypothetical protein
MSAFGGPNIITDALVLNLDAGNSKSYPGSGTTWYDKSGFGNNGTLINGPTFDAGLLGSIVFDGVNDFVDLGVTNLSTTLSSLTLNVFLKIIKLNTKQAIISSYTGSPQGGWGIELLSNNTLNFFGFSNTTTFTDVQTPQTYTLNQILNICCVFGNSTFIIYVNGVQSGLKSGVSTIYRTSTIRLGITPPPAVGIPFQGNIYQTSIYNRALSASEVLQNYNATKGRFGFL